MDVITTITSKGLTMKTLVATLIASACAATFAIAPASAQDKTTTAEKTTTSSGNGLVSRIDTTDPKAAEAAAKCEQATGDARSACLIDHKGKVTSAGAAVSATGARIADGTREAVATVKEKTAAAVDRTKEMASSATRKTGDAASDSAVTTKVKAGLAAEPELASTGISVDTKDGVVTLSGSAKSKAEANRAVAAAKRIEGVTSVKNTIKVK